MVGCPGAATFTCQHVRARMYLRMASLTYMARSGLRATERSLARLLTLETFSLACKRVRLLPLWALSGPALHRYLSLSARRVFKKKPHTPVAWTSVLGIHVCLHVRISHQIPVRPERTSGHGDPVSCRRGRAPLELDGWSRGLGSSHGDCERLPHLPPDREGSGALAKIWTSLASTRIKKNAHHSLPECRWMSHQTACPEARPNTTRVHRHQ